MLEEQYTQIFIFLFKKTTFTNRIRNIIENMDWLKGKHVKLRAVEPEDLKNLYKWENDSTLWNVSDTITPFSKYILKG